MKDDLNFKAVLLRLINNNKPQKQMVLTPQRFFGMQPYFDLTRKTTLKKCKTTSIFILKNQNDDLKKMEDDWEEMEDDHKQIKLKTTSKEKWKTTSKNKMRDEPINKNQPNWL